MALNLVDYERKAGEAVQAFWGNRAAARQKQVEAGKADQGERAGVTGGKNMDGFIALVSNSFGLTALLAHKSTSAAPY
jgi:hypothetical protein